MSNPLLGLDFDDIIDPIVEAVGEGAYEIGGGEFRYGQNRTEADVKQLFRVPVPLPDLSDALALFEEYLGWIPLDGLRQFRNLLPDVTDGDFSDVPTAVSTIINGLTDKPLNQILLDFLRQALTGVSDATDDVVQELFGNMRDFLGIDFATGDFDVDVARETFVTYVIEPFLAGLAFVDQAIRDALTGIVNATPGDVDNWVLKVLMGDSPLDANNLFNIVPPTLLGQIDISHIGTNFTNLLTDPFFLNPVLDNVEGWVHNLTGGFGGLGSMSVLADGTTNELLGNRIPVSKDQRLPIEGKVKWSGLTGTGNPVALAITGYNVLDEAVHQQTIDSHSTVPPTTDWLTLSGTYTVPADVVAVRLRSVVTAAATAGTVSFSNMSVTKIGTLMQRLISGTDPGTFLHNDVENLFSGIISNSVEILSKTAQEDFDELVSTIAGDFGDAIADVGNRIGSFLDHLSPLNADNISSGNVADDFVEGVRTTVDNIVTRLLNIGGSGFSHTDAAEAFAAAAGSATDHGAGIAALFARLSGLESKVAALPVVGGGTGSGTADGGALGVSDTDTFERTSSSSLGGLWLPSYRGGSSSGIWATPNGHDATWNGAGTTTREFLMIRNNPAILRSETDYQRVTLELSSKADRYYDPLLGTFNFCGFDDIWLRVSDATTSLDNITGIRIRWGGDGGLTIYRFVNGVGTLLAGLGTGGITPPGPGAALIGEAGDLVNGAPRYFRAKVGTANRLQVSEVGVASGLGAAYRRWGHGGLAEGHLVPLPGQQKPGGAHFWNGMDQTR